MVHHIRSQESESEDEDSISDNVETIEDYSVCNINENEKVTEIENDDDIIASNSAEGNKTEDEEYNFRL